MIILLKQRVQYGKQLVGQLISFLMVDVVVVVDLLILLVAIIVYIWER